jgi:hypothetical protein
MTDREHGGMDGVKGIKDGDGIKELQRWRDGR